MKLFDRATGSIYLFLICFCLSYYHANGSAVAESAGQNLVKSKESSDSVFEQQATKIYSSFDESTNFQTELKTDETGKLVKDHRLLVSITETGEAGVSFTLVDSSTAELQKQADIPAASFAVNQPPLQNSSGGVSSRPPGSELVNENRNGSQVYVVRAEPKVVVNSRMVEELNETKSVTIESVVIPDKPSPPTASNESSLVTAPPHVQESQPHEDIPSFNEWTQKQLAEAEKKKGENGTSPPGSNVGMRKVRSKNYASPDCGAKVVAANPEAKSAGLVLSPSRDEYLLNTCNSRIWFVVELCEAIQAKKVELANFELFSSSPKNFSVSVSDRFPTRDWTLVGHLTAKDERVVQSFNLLHFHFAKYVRVELLSHYGSEHFCPISLFRVYGASEIEVLDTVDEAQIVTIADEEEDDEDAEKQSDQSFDERPVKDGSQNLFGTARDAVLSIVKKAAQALGSGSDAPEGLTEHLNNSLSLAQICTTPSHIIVCDNCTEQLFYSVYNLISCHEKAVNQLVDSSLIYKTLIFSDICKSFGLDFSSLRSGIQYPDLLDKNSNLLNVSSYLSVMLPKDYLAAICNFIAVKEKKVVLNVSAESVLHLNDSKSSGCSTKEELEVILPELASTCSVDETQVPLQSSATLSHSDVLEQPEATVNLPHSASTMGSSVASQIKPTKTVSDEVLVNSQNHSESSLEDEVNVEPSVIVTKANMAPENESFPAPIAKVIDDEMEENETSSGEKHIEQLPDPTLDSIDSETYENFFSELGEPEESTSSSPPSASPPILKESVFIRLANRIKALERNMSLSGQYLEELSRRYKKQVEEMQRALSASLEERRRVEEKEHVQSIQLEILTNKVEALSISVQALLDERNSWVYKASTLGQHSVLIFLEIFVFIGVLLLCRWVPEVEVSKRKISLGLRRNQALQSRRKSFDSIVNASHLKKRRPSEEALQITGSMHQDLLISETSQNQGIMKNEVKKRRRKKRELSVKSVSSSSILPSGGSLPANRSGSDLTALDRTFLDSGVRWSDQILSLSSSAKERELTTNNGHREVITPVFFKTAVSSRNQRSSQIGLSSSVSNRVNGTQSSESDINPSFSTVSDSQSNSSTPVKDRKKPGGIKKIVKKFF